MALCGQPRVALDSNLSLMVLPWSPEHSQGAVEVVRAVFDEYGFTWDEAEYHADLYDVPTYYLSKGNLFYVSIVDGRVVGTVGLELFPPVPGVAGVPAEIDGKVRISGCDCSLERLYVHPEARRMGVGSALFEKAVAEAQARGCRAMEIWSDKRLVDAHRLYKRYGAKPVSERVCDDPDLSPEWGLILNL